MKSLIVTREATYLADWACYVDDVLHQDPEVARLQGYRGVIMPEAALSVASVAPELIDLDLLRAGRLRRHWIGHAPAVEGAELAVAVDRGDDTVLTTFTNPDGASVAVERLEPAEPRQLRAVETTWRTGPIDTSRIRALLWSIGCLTGTPAWEWGSEPEPLVERAVRLLLPSIIAGRAATGPARWAHRVTELTCQPTGAALPRDARVEAATCRNDVVLTVAGAPLAAATVKLRQVDMVQA